MSRSNLNEACFVHASSFFPFNLQSTDATRFQVNTGEQCDLSAYVTHLRHNLSHVPAAGYHVLHRRHGDIRQHRLARALFRPPREMGRCRSSFASRKKRLPTEYTGRCDGY